MPSGTGLSNLDVGVYFMPDHSSDLIFRVGLILPTASDTTSGSTANALTVYERLTDILLVIPHLTALRLAVSTVQQSGLAFFRGDLGLDLVLDHESSFGSADALIRANLAGGVRLPVLDLAVELVNVGVLDGHADSFGDRFIHTVAVGFSTRGADQFRMGLVFPLNDDTRGEFWILSLGYQHTGY